MADLSDFQVGQTVELSDGRLAIVQFVGNTHFAAGDWIGVELEDVSGKNDGQVQGQRYFDCPPGRGMFVRPAAATVLDQPTPKPAARSKPNGTVNQSQAPGIASSGLKGKSTVDPAASKRQSINAASPTPVARANRLISPSKSPTKQPSSAITTGSSTRTNTPPSTARKSIIPPAKPNRTSMGPPPPLSSKAKAPRPSISGTLNGTPKPLSQPSSVSRGPSHRLFLRPGTRERLGSTSEDSRVSSSSGYNSLAGDVEPEALSPTSEARGEHSRETFRSPLSQESSPSRTAFDKPSSFRGRSPPTTQRPISTPVVNREIEDLKTKLRLMEKKRTEDREKLKSMEKLQADRDKFEGIIHKLQSKYQPQSQELAELKKQFKEEEAKLQALEGQQGESDSLLEVATLDREMAEETAESLKLELETLRQRYEEMELEVDVLREENHELGKEISPEDKTSQGWLQLERSNERLREALMRLRDVTQQQEADLRDQVAELESDLQDLTKIKGAYTHTKETLEQSEATVDDLRGRLDTAFGAEEMIEELTEKNLALNEKLEDLRTTIEDLESLKELNDELEINHTETEKQLQEEIDYNEALLSEEARKAAVRDGTIQDLEYTVSRFRELVTNMQTDLEDMRASRQITETEANELNHRSRAMMDLNIRLQHSASKTQTKTIDVELGKMQAQESSEHLAIVQLFLPESFRTEQDSVQALLRFRRIGFKANMLRDFVKERLNGPTVSNQDGEMFAYCDVLDKLMWIASTCNRFINGIQTCDLDGFKRLGIASHELEPVERALNAWIDGLKKDELKAAHCANELQRSIALMSHLAEIHIDDSLEHYPDKVLMHATVMQSHLESTSVALAHVKSVSEARIPLGGVESESDEEDVLDCLRKLDTLIAQIRSAKVISSKAVRQLEDLKSRSLTLEPSTLNVVEGTHASTSELAMLTRAFGGSLLKSLSEENQDTTSALERLMLAMSSDLASMSSLSSKLQVATSQIQTFYNLTTSLTQTVEFPAPPPPPPWRLLAQKMRSETADIAAREKELGRLKDEVSDKNTSLAVQDKTVEEMSVKIEVLEKRVGESGGRRERVRELELVVETAKSKEKDLLSKLIHLRTELQTLESERETWKEVSKIAQPSDQQGRTPITESTTSESSLRQINVLKSEIKALQASIRYLRSETHTRFLNTSHAFLSTPITRPILPPRPIEAEAKAVLKEMLHLVDQPDNRVVTLQARPKEERLRWRPATETSTWKLQKQKEEWEQWREWRDGVAGKVMATRREGERRRGVRIGNAVKI